MTPVPTLTRRQLSESRWMLGITATSLFLLCWLLVFGTNRVEKFARERAKEFGPEARRRIGQRFGGPSFDGSSTSLELSRWREPPFILVIALWAISRATAAVAGEIEKGSLDIVMSRPVSRKAYLFSQILTGLIGSIVLAAAMIGGMTFGNALNYIEQPPELMDLVRPSLLVVSLGLAIYGIAIALSAIDIVRWRPMVVVSVLTLAMYIAPPILAIPGLENYKPLEKLSIFLYYDPVEAGLKGVELAANAGKLLAVGGVGMALAFLAFARRDLPANA